MMLRWMFSVPPPMRLEISVMLDELLARMPGLHLADPDAAPEYRPANFVSGLEAWAKRRRAGVEAERQYWDARSQAEKQAL